MINFAKDLIYMPKKQFRVLADPEFGNVVFRKNPGSRRLSIRIHPVKGVSVIVPWLVPYAVAEAFFNLKRERIGETMSRLKEKYADVPAITSEQIEDMRRRAKEELPARLAVLAERYGFSYNRVTVKHNSTNWGSCSAKNNINLNLNLVRLPRVLCDYVLLHELCHLRHHDHGQAFHLLLEHVFTDNMLKLVEEGDGLAIELSRKTAASRAKYPLDYVCTRALKQYSLV